MKTLIKLDKTLAAIAAVVLGIFVALIVVLTSTGQIPVTPQATAPSDAPAKNNDPSVAQLTGTERDQPRTRGATKRATAGLRTTHA
jgi:hypothetical protein